MINKVKSVCLVILLLFTFQIYAQSQKILGVITDQDSGKPLPGVSILLKDGGVLGASDASGRFSVDVNDDKSILVFKYIGYSDLEVPIGSRKVLQIKMFNDNKVLDEVVVVGYSEVQRKDLTGSVGSANVKDMHSSQIPYVCLGSVKPTVSLSSK